jgi:autotransporter-associated beta strand protein
VTVKRGGVLDLNTTGYTGTPTYLAGSTERWSSDGARSGLVNLGAASLQIANDQLTTSGTLSLNGGSIEGFLARDSQIVRTNGATGAVTRTLGAGVSFVLEGDSFLGQNITGGINGLESGVGQTFGTPYTAALTGTLLDIKGVISGSYGLTKQGFDTVTLSGANTYTGTTNVTSGVLRIGRNDALPTTSALVTRGNGVLDLNGFDQTVGRLASPAAAPANGLNVMGFITNTATSMNTLTAGSGSLGDAVYGGVIQGNIALVKTGTSALSLSGRNTYTGGTTIEGGWLEVTNPNTVGTGALSVTGGAFAGNVTLDKAVTVSNGSGRIEPGSLTLGGALPVSNVGTMTLPSLNVSGGELVFQLGATSDSLVLTAGSSVLSGTTSAVVFSGTTYLTIQSGTSLAGTYPLITYSGTGVTAAAGTSNLVLGFSNPINTVVSLLSDANSLSLQVGTYTGALVWTGRENGVWDTALHYGQKNWKQTTGYATDFASVLAVEFGDTAASGTIAVAGVVAPTDVLAFNGNTLAYTLNGAGVIAGTSSLVKSGSALLTSTPAAAPSPAGRSSMPVLWCLAPTLS